VSWVFIQSRTSSSFRAPNGVSVQMGVIWALGITPMRASYGGIFVIWEGLTVIRWDTNSVAGL
jgi:hypothetical protein